MYWPRAILFGRREAHIITQEEEICSYHHSPEKHSEIDINLYLLFILAFGSSVWVFFLIVALC